MEAEYLVVLAPLRCIATHSGHTVGGFAGASRTVGRVIVNQTVRTCDLETLGFPAERIRVSNNTRV